MLAAIEDEGSGGKYNGHQHAESQFFNFDGIWYDYASQITGDKGVIQVTTLISPIPVELPPPLYYIYK